MLLCRCFAKLPNPFSALMGNATILLELKRLPQSYWNSKDQLQMFCAFVHQLQMFCPLHVDQIQTFFALLVHHSLSCRLCLQRCFQLVISSLLDLVSRDVSNWLFRLFWRLPRSYWNSKDYHNLTGTQKIKNPNVLCSPCAPQSSL